MVDTVTVSVDGGPAVAASCTVVPHQSVPAVLFSATVQAPSDLGPHGIGVVATLDNGTELRGTVTVIVQAPAGQGAPHRRVCKFLRATRRPRQ